MKKGFSFIMALCMIIALIPLGTIHAYAADSSYSAQFSYNGKQYSAGGITGTQEIQLSTILTPLEINGTVTAASVSEGQGMTVTTTAITLTKAFGTGWLKVTAGGTEHQITITSTPDSISVVLYGTLFFDKNGGSGIMDGQPVQEYTQTVLPDCAFTPPDGYEFDQWEINGARYNAGATYTFGQTTTAKAIWKLREGVHSITAVYNNSDGDVVVSPTMAAADEQVTVTVQPVAGKAVDSISYSYGSTTGQALSGGEGGVYTFSMPGEDTTVSVTFKDAAKEPIAYVDEDGNSKNCTDYSYIRSTDTAWSGWVVASQNLTLDSRVTVSGTVNLILMDGKTLTIAGGIGVGKGTTLNIYAQSGNSGKLIAGSRSNSYYAGIGAGVGTMTVAHYGNITINGGVIEAEGGTWSAGIGGSYMNDDSGVIVIRGNANVTAYGTENAAAIGGGYSGSGGKITIQGNPVVTATGRNNDSAGIGGGLSGSFSQINISGGTVTATGGNRANAIGSGRGQAGGTISITGGNVTATATGSSGAGIGSQCDSITIGGNAVVNATGASRGAGIGGCYQNPGGKITIADNANVTAVGGAYAAGIGTGYNAVADGETAISITGGTVNASIASSYGAAAIGSGNNAMGKTTISISNGSVTASGSSIYGVGIGGGNSGASGEEVVVNITGGTVNASGRAGIGTANNSNAKQTINISGGMVTARGAIDGSNKCAAIGQGNNSNSVTEINITGGIVRALGTGTGIGSGANSKQTPAIKLDYTDETKNGMEITAIDYNGTVTLNNSFKYQDSAEAVTDPITANKTIVPSDSTAHTHSFTYDADGATITATCANSDNQCNLTENKATLTIGEPDGKTSMVYDGTAKAAVLTGGTDVLTADVVYKKGDTVLPAAPSDAGSYTASISLGEATATVSYEITKKPVTFASITAKDKVYDGTTEASCSIGTGVNGAVSGDSVSANVSSGVANFDTPDVGVNKEVTFINWTLQGGSKNNYEMVQPEPQYRTITPRVITITAKAQTVQQGGTVTSTPEQVEVTGGTLVDGQRISEITLTGDTSAETTSGTVTPSAVKILDASDNDVTANYAVNYTAGTLTVTAPLHTHDFAYSVTDATITATCSEEGCPLTSSQAALTINAPTELTYDGKAKAATITGDTSVLGTLSIAYKQDTTALDTAPVNAGTYTASITLGTGDNTATASVSYTIAPKPVIITGVTATNRDYEAGNLTVALSGGTVNGVESGDTVDVDLSGATGTMTDANAGTNKAVTVTGAKLGGADAGNYTLSEQPTGVTVTINRIDYTGTTTASADVWSNQVTTNATLALPDLPDGASYAASGTIGGTTALISSCSVSDTTLTYSTTSQQDQTSATITVAVTGATNYKDYDVVVTVTVRDKDNAGVTISGAPTQAKTYGDADFTLTGIVTDVGTGTGVWTWSTSDESIFQITANGATATVKILKAGSATVTARYESDTTLDTETTDTIMVNTKTITITAKDQSIYVGGTVPTLSGADFYTVTGLVGEETLTTNPTLAYQKGGSAATPDNTTAGTYDIVASGASAGDNYAISYTKGTLTISEKQPATVTKAPAAKTLTYTGSAQALVTAGTASGGTMQYALGTDDQTAPTDGWGAEIPTAKDAKTYYVWYKAVGDADHIDSAPACVTVTIAALTEPVINGYALELGGVLGLRYYMLVPEGFDGNGAAMTFTMNNRENQVIPYSGITTDGQGKFFTCNVYAYQMADTITATFTYKKDGATKTLTDTYSVAQYLNNTDWQQYSQAVQTLVTKTRAYGHFIQPYLARVHGWTVGGKYAALDYSGTVDVSAAKSGSEDKKFTLTTMDSAYVQAAQYRLLLNADTSLIVEVRLKNTPAGSVSMTVNGNAVTPTVSGTAYRVEIGNIAANNLGVTHRVVMEIGSTTVFDFTASPLSYVYTVLSKSNPAADEQNALAALYEYWQAAAAYNSHT